MAYVAVGFLAVVCLVNLLLVLALARRVRGHGERLAQQSRLRPISGLAAGQHAPDFTVTTVSGQSRSRSDLVQGDWGLVAFLTPDCAPCRAQVPELKKHAAAGPSGPSAIVAVICATEHKARPMVAELKDAVSVVVEPLDGSMQQTFAVTDYPTFFVINQQGRIGARGSYFEAWNGQGLRLAAH
jgi:peroxiredoxin